MAGFVYYVIQRNIIISIKSNRGKGFAEKYIIIKKRHQIGYYMFKKLTQALHEQFNIR